MNILYKIKYIIYNFKILYIGVVLNKNYQEPPFRKSFASFRGPKRVAFSKNQKFILKIKYIESNKLEYKL